MGTEDTPRRIHLQGRACLWLLRCLAAAGPAHYIWATAATRAASGRLASPAPPDGLIVSAIAPELYFTEWNWADVGGARVTPNPGAYLLIAFGSGTAVLLLDQSHSWAGALTVAVSLDGGEPISAVVGGGLTNVTLAWGLPAGRHEARVTLEGAELSSGADRWGTDARLPPLSLRVIGVRVDAGQMLPAAPRPGRMLVLSDSIAEGYGAAVAEKDCAGSFFGKPILQSMSATAAWPLILGRELNAEVSVVGWTTCGWAWPGAGGVPPFVDSWKFVFHGHPRSWDLAPDRVIVVHGANDVLNPVPAGSVEAAVRAWVPRFQRAAPGSELLLVVPFGGFRKEEISAGIAQFGSSPHFIDLGGEMARGLSAWGRTSESCDGIHPYRWRHEDLAQALATRISEMSEVPS